MAEFKFLQVQDDNSEWIKIYVDNSPWVGSNAFNVNNSVATKENVKDGVYTFADGRKLTINDGKVLKIRTFSEVVIEDAMEVMKAEMAAVNEKFDSLTQAILELAKAKEDGRT